MKLSDMKQLLAARNIRLTKSLGQNFLCDGNQLRRIADAAELTKADKVLEIGPGLGPLTELLLERAGHVLAIEKDARLAEVLAERFPTLDLVSEDALDYFHRADCDWSDWKLVSNLPYSVASPILIELARSWRGPRRFVVTLQLEVARRLMAESGSADYGVLTLLIQLDYEPLRSFKIPAGCFFPQPEVDSACVCLVRRVEPLVAPGPRAVFTRIVKRSFSQRRKMMIKLLREDWPAKRLETAFDILHLPREVRAETVGLEQFVRLATILPADSAGE